MKSEETLKTSRKDFAESLKAIVSFANKSEELSDKTENEILEHIQGGLTMVQILDWVLDNEDLDFDMFCKKKSEYIANEFGFNRVEKSKYK